MINAWEVQKALGVKIYSSPEMNVNMLRWLDLYSDNFEYGNGRIKNIGLPLAISSEFARLAMTEFSCSLANPSADRDFQLFADKLNPRRFSAFLKLLFQIISISVHRSGFQYFQMQLTS